MPELPEVQTIVTTLAPSVVGQSIIHIPHLRSDMLTPAGFDLIPALLHRTITTLTRRAKRIVFALDDGNRFYIHLGMTGRLTVESPDATVAPHTHFIADLAERSQFGDDDPPRADLAERTQFGDGDPRHAELSERSQFGNADPRRADLAERTQFGDGDPRRADLAERTQSGDSAARHANSSERTQSAIDHPRHPEMSERTQSATDESRQTEMSERTQLRFRDPRRFGGIFWLGQADPFDQDLGPEPLTLRAAQLHSRLRNTTRPLKNALLDQTLIAGLGNIYVDESLHAARLHPLRRCDELSATESAQLCKSIKQVLKKAIKHRGSTLRDYVDATGVPGAFQSLHAVYARATLPCRRCKTPVEKITLAGRSTHFCPECQPRN